ncbi:MULTISPECIES: glycosyltransferase family 2 protein [Bacillus]|uniref:glycosyltransferase family 2 protein n=1 Tax=Bacillus TaxID=1386 RepID=UPI000BA6785C|nr:MULTISPECIES: glycosyltransferase family 2 protein [Bacillus]MBG9816168.1 glycosyltransferase [Bacillus safensis]OYN64240.1 glycosyltransferase [Bacillus safensis]QRF31875.1 glycosyltransferase family 2 protein [Bacillus safensis]QRY36964.1 glycosyltransferase family 2 protein [Bacillus sp. PDNC022]UXO87672.1 glycosyltransferase [Bacillus safensis]
MSQYKLSVVVLVYNTEYYLKECLDSLVNQSLPDLQIIAVNDESPDNSAEILNEYEKKYPNITVIHQKNSGGANAGNHGLKYATGEYITLMDSDDILPLDAYEKLYLEAKRSEADIVIGRPNILINGVQKEIIYKKEREVWQTNRLIEHVKDYPDIFYDGFYWNKIFRRELIFEHQCFMPPGMLYADRPMVHKAFLYAKKIAIITDVVYLWRKRGEEATQKSITQLNGDLRNFQDRIESLKYQMQYFEAYGDKELENEFLKRNIERLFFPIKNIVLDKKFRHVFYKEIKPILQKVDHIFDNDLGITSNLYIYFILNDLHEELIYYLAGNPKGNVIKDNGKFYWSLPFFRNKTLDIPDELFEIKVLKEEFIKINKIGVEDGKVLFEGIDIPKSFDDACVFISFESRHNLTEKTVVSAFVDHTGKIKAELSLKDFNQVATYDIYIIVKRNNKEDKFRISNKMYRNKLNNFKDSKFNLFFTSNGKLSLENIDVKLEQLILNEVGIFILTEWPIIESGAFYFKNRITQEKIFMERVSSTEFKINWKHFFEGFKTYDLFYYSQERHFRLRKSLLTEKLYHMYRLEPFQIEFYETDKGNISLKSSTFLTRLLSKLKG